MAKKTEEEAPKKKVWRCANLENECDMMGCKYAWCHAKDSPHRECNCGSIFVMQHCPWFTKGEKAVMLTYNDYDEREVQEYLAKMHKEQEEKDAAERALYLQLKKKFEGC